MLPLNPKSIGILLALSGFSIFAISDVCVKSTSMALQPLTVALYMNIFTTLFLIPIVIKSGGIRKSLKTATLTNHYIRSMFMLCNFLCVIYVLGHLPVASFYVIVFLYPFVVNMLAMALLKETISFHRWLAIAAALIGIIIAFRPESIPLTLLAVIALLSCFFNASATLSVKFIDKKSHWLSYPLYLMIFQTPIIIALMVWKDIPLIPDIDKALVFWFIGGGLAYALGLSLMPQAIQRIDASLVGAMIYIVFPWGLLYGYFIFNDVPDVWTLTGAVIIIASGLFLIYRERLENR
jgi:drug/metabolite transporter (DMT)-like permease